MKITVIGAGYVGLSAGMVFAYLGNEVTFLDLDREIIGHLRDGTLPIYEPHLKNLMDLVKERIRFTDSYSEAIPGSQILIIAVRTPNHVDGNPDLEPLKSAAEAIGKNLEKGFKLIIIKSTIPVGGIHLIESLVQKGLEGQRGNQSSSEFAVAYNPEFQREGSALHDFFYPWRVVVGSENPEVIDSIYSLYKPILEQRFVPPNFLPRPEGLGAIPFFTTNPASAELIKYAANAFLATKISFINEIAELAEKVGADIAQVAKGIGMDPRIGTRYLQAGIGWGGSCLGKDTRALSEIGRKHQLNMLLMETIQEINRHQRKRVIEKLQAELKNLKGRSIGLLGLSFKPQTDDLRDAPALAIAHQLLEFGAKVKAHDPVALEKARKKFGNADILFCDLPEEVLDQSDAVILVTDWPEYRDLPWDTLRAKMKNPLVLDGRNFLDRERLIKAGFHYIGLGR